MGFWDWFTGRNETKQNQLQSLLDLYGGRESSSGVTITVDTALQIPTVLSILRVLSEGVAQVPVKLHLDDGDKRQIDKDHPVHKTFAVRPNDWQTSFELRETIMLHLVLTGNAFVFVNRVGSAREIKELVAIEPGKVTVVRDRDGSFSYKVRQDDGKEQLFPSDAIWHVRGPSWNTTVGLDVIKLTRDAMGLSVALERSHSDFHKNGAKVGGLLSVNEKLSKERFEFLAAWLDKYTVGGERHGKDLILDLGAKFTSMGMTGVDAEHLETRKHQKEELCAAFRVMPIMIGHADKTATYASAEQMFLAHVIHTLLPWYTRIEQSANVNLLSEAEREQGYYLKFLPNALMRGAAADRASFYSTALGSGGHGTAWMTPNEVRGFEELDKIDDPQADKLPSINQMPESTE